MPPGLSENGVENVSALTLAHKAVLETNSYTVQVEETIRYENGSLRGSKRATYPPIHNGPGLFPRSHPWVGRGPH